MEDAMKSQLLLAACGALLASACTAGNGGRPATTDTAADSPLASQRTAATTDAVAGAPFKVAEMAQLREPWAMTFLPDGRLLVTEKRGTLRLIDPSRAAGDGIAIDGVPEVDHGGQGGLGDVVLHPQFERNSVIYLSY